VKQLGRKLGQRELWKEKETEEERGNGKGKSGDKVVNGMKSEGLFSGTEDNGGAVPKWEVRTK
jgi:hypothetical protein